MKAVYIILVLLTLVVQLGCKKTSQEDIELIIEKNANGGGSGSGSQPCYVGDWTASACGGAATQNFVLKSDGTGWADNPDCNGVCYPLVWKFHYEVNGNTISLIYDNPQDDVYCEGYGYLPVDDPTDADFTFTCSGKTLETSFGTFYK